jgi:transposase
MEFRPTMKELRMQPTHVNDGKAVLAVSLELSGKSWKLALSDGRRAAARLQAADATEPGARLQQTLRHIQQTRELWKLPSDCAVTVIYEAGQDAFWIERALRARGVQVLVVDAASVPVARQTRRAKTDRLDALSLLNTLLAWLRGECGQVRMVHVPSEQAEASRQLSRDRGELQKEIGQHRDRMRKLLRTVGCWQELKDDARAQLDAGELRDWSGQPLPEELSQRLRRESERLALVQGQLKALEAQLMAQLPPPLVQAIAQLASLKGVGPVGAMRLVLELYWRNFRNRRQVGSCVGLVAQPYDSGDSRVDQGISKQGNRRVRALLIEMAWMWLRYQPDSQMAQWFARRTAGTAANKRAKRIAIVAVARRLAIALWRFLQDGVVPAGAQLKRA